ncbi:phage terminase large subunit [Streptomyces ambofaciens]
MFTPLAGKALRSTQLATARGNLWEGAVRSSKTISSIMVWLRYIRTGPPGALLMVGKTERTLKRNIIDVIVQMIGKKRCDYRAGAGEVVIFGRTIYVAGANDERAADKIKGLTLAGAYLDEVTTYPETFFQMLETRLSVEGAQWYGTTNPEGPNHWLKKQILDRARLHLRRDGTVVETQDPDALDVHRFSFVLDDNPSLPAAYVASLKRSHQGLFFKRYILGEWCLAEGVIYDSFDEAPARRGPGPGDLTVDVRRPGLRHRESVRRAADRDRRGQPHVRRQRVPARLAGGEAAADGRAVQRRRTPLAVDVRAPRTEGRTAVMDLRGPQRSVVHDAAVVGRHARRGEGGQRGEGRHPLGVHGVR